MVGGATEHCVRFCELAGCIAANYAENDRIKKRSKK